MKYHGKISQNNYSTVLVSGFKSKWNASGQIPDRSVESDQSGWFKAIDPNEGGNTSRYNANIRLINYFDNGAKLTNQLYFSKYDFELFSNFTFFLNDTEVGENLFINKKIFLQLCRKKNKENNNMSFPIKNLSQYKMDTGATGNITGIDFIFYDQKNRTNSGYPGYSVSFKWKEIEKFIAPQYRKRLIQ